MLVVIAGGGARGGVDVVADELISVEVTWGDVVDVVGAEGVAGWTDPGTGAAEGVAVCEDWMLISGYSDQVFSLKGRTTYLLKFFWKYPTRRSAVGSATAVIDDAIFWGRTP